MNAEKVLDPVAFARELGRLHDMEISRLVFCAEEKSLCIHVDDLNADFSDLDEYKGCKPCRLMFRNVTGFLLDVETAEGIRIDEASVSERDTGWRIEVDLNLGGGATSWGRRSIVIDFEAMLVGDSES